MIAFAYAIPVVACLLLYFALDFRGEWWIFLCVLGGGEGFVGLLHFLFMRRYMSAREYLGSMVDSVHYEAPWTELRVRYETRTDSKGRSYTVRRVDRIYHPEQYYFFTTIGSRYDTDSDFFSRVVVTWQLPRRNDSWSGGHIQGGIRFGHHYTMDDFTPQERENPENWIAVTERHSYKNKIQCSNSIFKFEKVSSDKARELGLCDYPRIAEYDAPAILSDDFAVTPDVDLMFRRFNARYASEMEMRLFILLFRADRGIGIAEMQRAYWQGGNKNEFVVCIGLEDDGSVRWARTFSWADEQTVEVETDQWLMHNSTLDWKDFHDILRLKIQSWKRKEFKDFDYINVTLPQRYFVWTLMLSIVENGILLYFLAIY